MAAWIIPAISAAADLVGNFFTNRANKKQAEHQYSTAQEQWNQANQYNDPKTQMLRLAEAGLNPNLVYGSNSVTGNTTTPAESYKAQKMQYDVPNVLNAYQDFQLKAAQTDNIRTNSENVRLKNITEGLNQSKIALDTSKNQLDYDIATTLKDFNIQKGISESLHATNQEVSSSWDWVTKMNKNKESVLNQEYQKTLNDIKKKDLDYVQRGLPPTGSGFEGDIMRLLWSTFQRAGKIETNAY